MGNAGEQNTILEVLKNVCARCTDRAEYRGKVAANVSSVFSLLSVAGKQVSLE